MVKSVAFPLAVKTAKLTTILLLAGVAAGCSSEFTRFSEAPFSSPFAEQADPMATGSTIRPQRVDRPSAVSPLVTGAVPRAAATALPAPADAAHLVPSMPEAAVEAPRLVPLKRTIQPLASAETKAQPELVFQSGAPFSARAAQIPFEAEPRATLANATDSEAAILRRKLKKLQAEVDALEATEGKKKPVLQKAADEEASSTKVVPAKPRKVDVKKTEPRRIDATAVTAEAEPAKPMRKLQASETAPKPVKAAEAEALPKKVKPKKLAVTEELVAPAVKAAPKKTAEAKSAEPKAKLATKEAKPKDAVAKPLKTASAEKLAKKTETKKPEVKKPKVEVAAKAEEKKKPVRVIETVPSRSEAEAETVAAPSSADDTITTANVTASVALPVDPGFRWPARGRVIQGFDGTSNRGVKIAMPEGTPVKAARDGKVIYVGEEVKGYGKLVLVRHDDGYVSAYGNNSALLVKRGDSVNRGAEIARSGSTGDVSSPMLHFELRKGASAVNPLSYLK
jgi:murein DD-endopeptidase MepM/ murein hydrolase activator NlpD